MTIKSKVQSLIWQGNKLMVLDQRLLPFEKKYLELTSYKQVIESIKNMSLRGAPLIGIAGAYGMALAVNEFVGVIHELPLLVQRLKEVGKEIKQSRPTAVNLKWAVDLTLNETAIERNGDTTIDEIINAITERAVWIHKDDADRCQKIGEYGLGVIQKIVNDNLPSRQFAPSPVRVLTICNTGSLATGGIGTAFGAILTAHQKKLPIKVFVCETRPRQQGARLTTLECVENGIDCTLISDTACGYLMNKGEIDLVITGADRIAANGDSANKIGTYQLAVLAKENNISFYVAAPLSTFDLSCASGEEIPIEERDGKEVKEINEKLICASGIKIRNPAFDVTPARYITGIVTEKRILLPDYEKEIKNVFNQVTIV